MFSFHVVILSILGVLITLDINKYLNEHVKKYFSIYHLSRSLEYSSSLAITTLSLDHGCSSDEYNSNSTGQYKIGNG